MGAAAGTVPADLGGERGAVSELVGVPAGDVEEEAVKRAVDELAVRVARLGAGVGVGGRDGRQMASAQADSLTE